ncbi:MAG: hypothetical protein L3J71_06120 [Victivallaceae bacterium]|nr:hypothetical protein [Victivallaceae bacterium]
MNINYNKQELTKYFSFDDKAREINIHRHDIPQPWINYLSNGNFHAFISQAGGGFAWWKSPTIFRLTRYRHHHLPIDSPGFYIYIRQQDGTIWSPAFRPSDTTLDSWRASHAPGMTTFIAEKNGVLATLSFFVPPDYDVLIWDLELSNKNGETVDLDIFAYVENSQLDWEVEVQSEYYNKMQLKTWFDKELESVNYLFHGNGVRNSDLPLTYLASSMPVETYSGSRNEFIGNYRSESRPIAVERGYCGNETLECGEPASALHVKASIGHNKIKRMQFFLGTVNGALVDIENAIDKEVETLCALRKRGEVDRQCNKLKKWWDEHFDAFQCELPNPVIERQINIWNTINSVQTGRYSRSVNTVAPGVRGVGFRDTSQDMLAIAYRRPKWAEEKILYLLSQQYSDGHVVHTAFPEEKKKPQMSIHSDDHLWPHLVVYAIVAETGDISLLEKKVPYLSLKDHESPDGEGTVWEHLVKAIEFTENNLGKHGLPLTMTSDWNDIIGRFNRSGEGETIFAGEQYVLALCKLIKLAKFAGKDNAECFEANLKRQILSLEKYAWDGEWWRRGFDDDSNPVGSSTCDAGKIFLNPQSWAVISGIGNKKQQEKGMKAVGQYLNTEVGLKILSPSFSSWTSGEEKAQTGFGPGCGENGGIFCHANTWAIIAEAMLGNGERAWQYFSQLIPYNVMKKVGIDRYRAEPYAWVSNIIGPDNSQFGWGNVEQITGTAPWMDITATQYLLGVRATLNGLLIDPCIPKDWDVLKVKRRYRGCLINITIENPDGVNKCVVKMVIDGKEIAFEDHAIITPLILREKKSVQVKIIMGKIEL